MVGDMWKKPVPGQPFKPSAAQFAAFIDAARAHRESQRSGSGPGINTADSSRLWIRNDSGADVEQFGVLQIAEPEITPSEDAATFHQFPLFSGVAPDSSLSRQLCIVLQPLGAGETGPALASGCAWCQIDVGSEADEWAAAAADETGSLVSTTTGGFARILWKESGTGLKWAFVRIEEIDVSDGNGADGSCGCGPFIEVGAVSCQGEDDAANVYVIDSLGVLGTNIELTFDAECVWISDEIDGPECYYGSG